MRQKITAGRLWGLISPMVLYMIVQVVVSGIVTFGIIFAANFVLHDYATFSASKIGMVTSLDLNIVCRKIFYLSC